MWIALGAGSVMKMLESLVPSFLCPRCGWRLSEDGGEADFLPIGVSFVVLVLAGAAMSASWRLALGVLWLIAVFVGRVVAFRCPGCGKMYSRRELTGNGLDHPVDEPPRGTGPDVPSAPA